MENSKLNDGDSSSSHREAKFKMERKPDFENESLRMWVPNNKEKKQYRKTDVRIKYKGYTFGLVGFTVAKLKGRVVFAFKFKPENKTVLAYKDDKNHEAQAIYKDLREYARFIGYQFSDVRDTWDRILMEEHTIRKLAGKADREGQLAS